MRTWFVLVTVLWLAACDVVAVSEVPSPAQEVIIGSQEATPVTQLATPTISQVSPSPTIIPASKLLERALDHRILGDYDAAATDLYALIEAYPVAPEARPARFYLAESFALRRRWASAAEAFRAFLSTEAQDDLFAQALFWLARCYEEAGAWNDAIATYERYRTLKTPLEPYAQLRQAAQERVVGQLARAAELYEAAASSDIVRGERAGAFEKAIALRIQLAEHDAALELYRKLLDFADLPDYRARLLAEGANLAEQVGQIELARGWRRELVEKHPALPQALDAVGKLLADPQSGVSAAVAAQVFMAHEQWSVALSQLDAAITAAPGESALELRRQRGLVRRSLGDFSAALVDLAAIGAESPNSEVGRQAQLDWVQTRGQSGETQAAIEGYRAFAQAYPDDPRAPEALSRAAILLERLGNLEGAVQQRIELGRRYPASDYATDARYEAGWQLFHNGRPAEAHTVWAELAQGANGIVAAQAAFWAARAAQQSGQQEEANRLLEYALNIAPDSFYGARAAELLGRLHEGQVPIGAALLGEDWRTIEDWIAGWAGISSYHVSEQGYPPEVAQFGPIVRAIGLQEVGLQPEAIAEWNAARLQWREDPLRLYLLAHMAYDHHVPYIALKAAEDLARRSPDKGFARAPDALRRLIFPTPYAELVVSQAHEHAVDPRALFAMMRQESLFNPGATSWAGARGLAQVMPATAQGIAQNLQVVEFQEADLYRPVISIRFGAFYLGYQLKTMEGSLLGALAAYNGGPGNAQRWAGGFTVADSDLFAESIDYHETREYVKLVYGYYGAYRRLYKK